MKLEKRGKIEKFWIVFVSLILLSISIIVSYSDTLNYCICQDGSQADYSGYCLDGSYIPDCDMYSEDMTQQGLAGGGTAGTGGTPTGGGTTELRQTQQPKPSSNIVGAGGRVDKPIVDKKEKIFVFRYEEDGTHYSDRITADQDGLFTYTRISRGTTPYFLDFISNKMPNPTESSLCTEIKTLSRDIFGEEFYVYKGSNFGWIGCKPSGEFPLDNLEKSTEHICGQGEENPHIRSLYDRIRLSSKFDVLGGREPEPAEGEEPTDIVAAFIPLVDAERLIITTPEQPASGQADEPPGQAETTAPSVYPEFMCVQRNNIAFWAGCGGNVVEERNAHNFYPGGMPTTLEDFGIIEYKSTNGDLKPGSKVLYNQVLALGVPDKISGEVTYDILSKDIDPLLYNDGVIYDWSKYDKLIFFFKAAKKPEFYKLRFKTMKKVQGTRNSECSFTGPAIEIQKYIDGEKKPNKWYKIEIPKGGIPANRDEIKSVCGIQILADAQDFKKNKVIPSIRLPSVSEWSGITFRDIVFLDRFTMISELEKERYCGFIDTDGNLDPDDAYWIKSVDLNADVCNEQPSYIWTGQRCCGDSDETYIDTANDNPYACWKGEGIANDKLTPFTEVKSTNMYCKARENCETEETTVLGLSDLTNAHGATTGNMPYSVCCKVQQPGTLIGSGTTILKLHSNGAEGGAHASTTTHTTYATNIDLGLTDWSGKTLDCQDEYDDASGGYEKGYTFCETKGYDTCLVSLSTDNDPSITGGAHLESCDNSNYPVKLCCKIQSGTQ